MEAALDVLAADVDRERIRVVLGRLHGFWQACEQHWPAVGAMDEALPGLDLAARRRAHGTAQDLLDLGLDRGQVDALPVAPAQPLGGTADLLGQLYVLEGSSLGGAVISRHLAGVPGLAGVGSRFFAPYGQVAGRRWRDLRMAATTWSGDDERRADTVVAAGVRTFGALAAWCEPLRRAADGRTA